MAILGRGVVDLVQADELEKRIASGRPLRVKAGFDPTRPDLHLGHTVVMQKMRQFQDLGHTVIFVVGDYTAMVGDPTGQNDLRPRLSQGEVMDAALTYQEQAFKVLDRTKTEIRYNSEWLSKFSPLDFIELAAKMTVARVLERDDFARRFAARRPIYVHEFLYPLLQAYDSIALECDIELGGTDQLYNLLAGRDVMAAYGLEPQVALTLPLLLSWDGEKMSSSVGNNIPLTAPPEEMFGRTMRIPDELLPEWYALVWERELDSSLDPMQAKLALARFIVERSHGPEAAEKAEEHFTRVVREHQAPEDVPEASLPDGDPVHLPALLAEQLGLGSTSEARRLIAQGGVKVDGEPVTELDLPRARLEGALVQAGKRRFMRFRAA